MAEVRHCECGCGAVVDRTAQGLPQRFVRGHNSRLPMPRGVKPTPAIIRLLKRVTVDESGCWIFDGAKSPQGYGQMGTVPGKTNLTHRVSYEHYVGAIPDGFHLHHTCAVRSCVNPAHLIPMTPSDHARILWDQDYELMWSVTTEHNRKKTHCPHGHPYSDANTYIDRTGRRHCRECRRIGKRRRRALARAGGQDA